MKALLNGFWYVTKKEMLHLRRDPAALVFALLIPVFQFVLFGFAINFDVRYIQTVVVDMDRTRESRDYIASLKNTHYLEVGRYLSSPEEAEEALRTGTARVAVIIPPDFARRSTQFDSPSVRVLIDGSDSQVATPARAAFLRPPDSGTFRAPVEPRINMLFNPDMRSQLYMIPGLIGIILQLVTVSLTSFSLVREREQGTMEQLMVSPVGRLGLMLGKLVPYAVLAMSEMAAVLILGRIIFDIQIAGSPLLLMVLSVPFVLASLALGLLISTVAQTQGQALQMTMLTTLPSFLLSGFIFPRETMPGPLYIASHVIPVTYFLQILRGIVVRRAVLADLWGSILPLLLIMVLLIALSTARFRKSST